VTSRPPTTEGVHPETAELGHAAPLQGVDLMLAADRGLLDAVAAAREEIADAVTLIAARLSAGGRLFYVGAGTSGRLGVLDAVECPPTFCTPPEWVQGVLAGGDGAMWRAVEGAEDDRSAGGRDLLARGAGANDVIVGITASGRTPYVHGALEWARANGAASVLLACVARDELLETQADVVIGVATGAESLAGSTRLRAGTATKLVLNMLSTLTMAQLGRVYGNLMVDVNTSGNAKLQRRGIALIERLVPSETERATELFAASDGQVKLAVVMGRLGVSREHAALRLQNANGFLDRAMAD
jgi:N-acetylmuramic acid 6-phosphate etherase